MCSKYVHATVTRASRFHCLIGVINKPTTVALCIYHPYTDDLPWESLPLWVKRRCAKSADAKKLFHPSNLVLNFC